MTLAIPTVLSSLAMVLYHLADTFFVGIFSMMIRALEVKDYNTVYRRSAYLSAVAAFMLLRIFRGLAKKNSPLEGGDKT